MHGHTVAWDAPPDLAAQAALVEQWRSDVLPHWARDRETKQVRALVAQGVPAEVRPMVWRAAVGNKLLLTRKKYEEALAKAEASKHSGIAGAASLDSLRKTRELIDTCERVGGEFAVEGSVEQQELVQVLEAHEAFRPDFGTPQPVLRLRLLTCCVCLTRHSCWCSLL